LRGSNVPRFEKSFEKKRLQRKEKAAVAVEVGDEDEAWNGWKHAKAKKGFPPLKKKKNSCFYRIKRESSFLVRVTKVKPCEDLKAMKRGI
jgi:hypothetical protein